MATEGPNYTQAMKLNTLKYEMDTARCQHDAARAAYDLYRKVLNEEYDVPKGSSFVIDREFV